MYISVIKEKTSLVKGFYGMTIATVFCVLFAVTYNHFGHGVQSFYMTYMFLCPLILGMMFYGAILLISKAKNISRFSFNIYNSGVATLTIGSMLMGIFEIAGTASEYIIAYGGLGSAMIIIGFITYILNDLRHV